MFGTKEEVMESPSMQRMTINIIDNANATKGRNKERVLAMQKSGRMAIGQEGLKRLEIGIDDYLLFGNVGSSWYVCKRPSNSFKGYIVRKQQGKKASTTAIYVQSKSLMDIPQGEYSLGEAFSQDGVFWRELIKND